MTSSTKDKQSATIEETEKQVIEKGTEWIGPHEGSECVINLEVCHFSSEDVFVNVVDFNMVIGETDQEFSDIIDGMLMSMKSGEISRFTRMFTKLEHDSLLKYFNVKFPEVTEEKNQTNETHDECQIQNSDNEESEIKLDIKIELKSTSNQKPIYKLTTQEKYQQAQHHKTKGNELFQLGDHRMAFKRYSRSLKYLIFIHPPRCSATELPDDYYKLRSQCYSNLAACQLNTGKYEHVITNCTKALENDSKNVKAFYRRGTAHVKLKNFDNAKKDFLSGLSLQPNSSALKHALHGLSSN